MARLWHWLNTAMLDLDMVWVFFATLAVLSLWTIEHNTTALVILVRDLRAREVAASTYGEDRESQP